MPSTLQLTTKQDAAKTIRAATTLAETTINTTADVNMLVKALREQMPFKVIIAK